MNTLLECSLTEVALTLPALRKGCRAPVSGPQPHRGRIKRQPLGVPFIPLFQSFPASSLPCLFCILACHSQMLRPINSALLPLYSWFRDRASVSRFSEKIRSEVSSGWGYMEEKVGEKRYYVGWEGRWLIKFLHQNTIWGNCVSSIKDVLWCPESLSAPQCRAEGYQNGMTKSRR